MSDRSTIRCVLSLDPDRLTQLSLTPNDVIAAVQNQNIQAALGRVGAAPMTSEQQVQINIKTKGRLTRPEEFAAIVVRANPDGSVVRVKDVARVEMSAKSQDATAASTAHRRPRSASTRAPGSNAVEVARQVRETMSALARRSRGSRLYGVLGRHGLCHGDDR